MREFTLKIILLGEGAVGKTSIRRNYMGQGFSKSHLVTLGADFGAKEVEVTVEETQYKVQLQIWDIAGQKTFEKMRMRFLAQASCILMVFDITNSDSFQKIPSWLQDAWEVNNTKNLPILIIGNKIDLEDDRKISKTLAVQFLTDLQSKLKNKVFVEYIETSALTGVNIEEGFLMIITALIKKMIMD